MEVRVALKRLGGVASTRQLRRICSHRRIAEALASGDVIRVGTSYALPSIASDLAKAVELKGVLSHESAALQLGWALSRVPLRVAVIVPRGRRVSPARRIGVTLRFRNLESDQVRGGHYTDPLTTLIDCAKALPFADALAVADSALRAETITPTQLVRAAESVRTTGRTQCLRVARCADGRAANPFESTLRALALDVPGLRPEPQARIEVAGFAVHPDLVDRDLGLVMEADSWAFHGGRREFARDCERYNELSLAGWTVLRFSYEAVMGDPTYVRSTLARAVGALAGTNAYNSAAKPSR
jgi:very-short-patch-repair endonuclease